MTVVTSSPVIVAMDYDNADDCLKLARQLSPSQCRVKVGKELFTRCGPSIVEQLRNLGFDVFLDLKFHDIPNTTAKAVKAAAELGVWMVNVHASGGERMMVAARNELEALSGPKPLLIAVTVLTSFADSELKQIGIDVSSEEHVMRLAKLTQVSGLDGVVCSAREASVLRAALGDKFALVTPGIRLPDSAPDDQRRTLTPVAAIAEGSSYLVIGRPITQSSDPAATCLSIVNSLRTTV